jgi:type IV pilus assembly protein PilN
MIRINLLPEAKRQVSTGGSAQVWGVVYLLSAVAWGVVLFIVYLNFKSVLEEQNAKNDELQGQIDRAKAQTQNIGEVEGLLAKSKELESVVGSLQTARQGPARMLMELVRILSEGGGPSVPQETLDKLRRENPLGAFNAGWDVRRLWLESFTETERVCTVRGAGKTNEDVAEFLRRLNLSEVFDKVSLQSTSAANDTKTGTPTVAFTLSCEVKY